MTGQATTAQCDGQDVLLAPNPNRLRRAFWVVVACNRFVYFARASAERKLAAVVERMEESTHLSAG